MDEALPLPTLISQALIAFTIELDNEFERRMPHTTTDFGGTRGAPWAVSLAMWSNFMRLLDDVDALPARELERRAGAKPHLSGMQRWGYVKLVPDATDARAKPPRGALVTPTRAGRRAQEVWRTLPAEIEQRWRERFGAQLVDGLRAGLERLVERLGMNLPEHLARGDYGGYAAAPSRHPLARSSRAPLSALLSQPLQALALEFERESELSLMFSANVIRVLDACGVRVAELPARSGVAIESQRTALGILAKRGHAELFTDSRAVGRLARLSEHGLHALSIYRELTAAIDERWRERHGRKQLGELRDALSALAEAPAGEHAPLLAGLVPPPGTWRSRLAPIEVLAHHPMPRQGGHPDGT